MLQIHKLPKHNINGHTCSNWCMKFSQVPTQRPHPSDHVWLQHQLLNEVGKRLSHAIREWVLISRKVSCRFVNIIFTIVTNVKSSSLTVLEMFCLQSSTHTHRNKTMAYILHLGSGNLKTCFGTEKLAIGNFDQLHQVYRLCFTVDYQNKMYQQKFQNLS